MSALSTGSLQGVRDDSDASTPTKEKAPRIQLNNLLSLVAGERAVVAVVAAISVVTAVVSLAQPVVVADVISGVERGSGIGSAVWVLVGLVIASGLLSAVQQYLLQRMGETVVLNARVRLIRRMFRLPISEYDHRHTGDLVSRFSSDTTLLRVALIQGLVAALSGSLTFVGAMVAMAIIDPMLLGVTLGVVVLSFVVVTALGSSIQKASTHVQSVMGDLTSAVERTLNAIRTVRAANATAREEAEVARLAGNARKAGLRLAKIAAVVSPVSGIATQVSFLAVLGVGGLRVASGSLSIADLVAFVLFLFMMIMPLSQAFEAITAVNQALGAYRRIHEILMIPAEIDDGTLAVTGSQQTDAPLVEFRDVTFSYPSDPTAQDGDSADRRPVLDAVSFSVERSTRVALVGPSGAGKSSILQLIERFYAPTTGEVLLDGVDITEIQRSSLRALIGYVEQDAPVLSGTFRSNLTLGAPDATDDECHAVLSMVNLSSLIDRDSRGLDATVGHNGVALSGGEKQRLAIARTLIAGPPILLLDESTSSLDSRNEQAMRAAIGAVAENRTLIVVAHRLSTVIDSDLIIVLENGKIVGTGTHDELLHSTPLYRELAEHQLLT